MRCSIGCRTVVGLGLTLALAVPAGWTAAADAPLLRYGFQAGKEYCYDVKIVADTDDSEETREGVISYKVLSATDQQGVVKHSGVLAARSKPKPGVVTGPPMFGPPGFGGPRGFGGPPGFGGPRMIVGPEGVTLNRQGKMLVARELTHLPFLLGDLELLVFEEFPAEARAQWAREEDIVVQERSSGPFPFMFGPPRAASTSQRTAKERHEYAVLGVQGDSIRLSRKYSLRTGNEGGGAPRFDMSGSGQFTFDAREGMIAAMAMKYEIRVNEPNVTLRVPVSLTYRLLTPAELAEHRKREEEAKAKAAAETAKANAPKPFEAGERERLLADLQSVDERKMQAAADRLAKAPADEGAAEVAKALAPLLTHSNDWVKGAAASALIAWATPEVEAELVQGSKSENLWVRGRSIQALGRVKTEKAAEAVAAQMYRNRGEAAKAMKEMGPVAEAAAISCLKDRDGWVRGEACAVLAEIGGARSLGALAELAKQGDMWDKQHADKAITAIKKRPAEGVGSAERPAKTAGTKPVLRTWRDASGVFEIEATLVDVQDGRVRLKRKDGRIIAVPIEKLSEADQAFLRRQTKGQ